MYWITATRLRLLYVTVDVLVNDEHFIPRTYFVNSPRSVFSEYQPSYC